MKARRHKWQGGSDVRTMAKCVRSGCACQRRFRRVDSARPYISFYYREEYSTDGGLTWGDLKTCYQGRVPECTGGEA